MQVTYDIVNTFCQSCTKYRIETDCLPTEKDELIKTQNTLREQTNQLISHIGTCTANLQNLENNIKPIKPKTKTMKMYPRIRKMFKFATGLDPDNVLAIF